MSTRINDVASSVQRLTLGADPYSAREKLILPHENIQELHRLVSTITTRAQLVKALVIDANTSVNPACPAYVVAAAAADQRLRLMLCCWLTCFCILERLVLM
jgi:hydrogenase maturation factor